MLVSRRARATPPRSRADGTATPRRRIATRSKSPTGRDARAEAMMRTLVIALALCGCAKLPAIEADRCGNGVLEAGEDCDTHAGEGFMCGAPGSGAAACRFQCSRSIGGQACPAGFGCGGDGICRAAGGGYLESPAS